MSGHIADVIIVVVILVWVGSVIAALVNPDLRDPQIHLVISAAIGGYFATRRKAGGDGDK